MADINGDYHEQFRSNTNNATEALSELIDNSLDAGATDIRIEYHSGKISINISHRKFLLKSYGFDTMSRPISHIYQLALEAVPLVRSMNGQRFSNRPLSLPASLPAWPC